MISDYYTYHMYLYLILQNKCIQCNTHFIHVNIYDIIRYYVIINWINKRLSDGMDPVIDGYKHE